MKVFLKNFTNSEKFYLLLMAAVSLAVMMPVLLKGLPYGYDLPHHFQCAMTFYESILAGDFYPSWSLNRNFGYGGMETRLYPPLSHYSLALFYLVTGNWHIAGWLTFTFFMFVGCLGVYLWAKEHLPARQAVFAGCIYALLPYHLNQLYNTFFFAEFVGSSVLPFTFVFIRRVCRRGKAADVLGLVISLAVLILTHLPLTVIGAICFTIYALTLLEREKLFFQIRNLGAGVIGALAASSFFWTKVLLEKNLMAKTQIYADNYLDYRLHFLLTTIQTYVGELPTHVYESSTYFYDLMLFYTLVLVLGCTIPFLIWKCRGKNNLRGIWLIFAAVVFLTLPFSRFIWDTVPVLQEVQFPWRWLTIVGIAGAVLSASRVNLLVEWFGGKKRPLALIVSGCILALAVFSVSQIIRPAPIIDKEEVPQLMAKNQKAIGFVFWWTIWARKESLEIKDKVAAGNRIAEIKNWTATDREFLISAGDATEARIAVFYHPNWKAVVNGVSVPIEPAGDGALLIPLSDQSSSVRLVFQEPFAVRSAQWVSGCLWLCLLLLGALKLKAKLFFE